MPERYPKVDSPDFSDEDGVLDDVSQGDNDETIDDAFFLSDQADEAEDIDLDDFDDLEDLDEFDEDDFEDEDLDEDLDLTDVSSDDTVGLYLKEMARVPLLTNEEEVSLAMRLEQGKIADEQLILLNGQATEEDI